MRPTLRQWIAVLLFMFVAFVVGYVVGGFSTYEKLRTEHKLCNGS